MNTPPPDIEAAEVATPVKAVRNRRYFGLFGKLMLGILAAGTIPIITGLSVVYVSGTNELKQVIGDSFAALAQESALQLDREIQRLVSVNRFLAQRAATDSQVIKTLSNRASAESSESPPERLNWNLPVGAGYDNKALLASWITKPGEGPQVDVGEATTSLVTMSGLRFDENIQRYIFRISVAIMGEQAELLGWLHRDYSAKIFLDPLVYPIRFGRTGHVMIVDNDGVIVSCPDLITGSRIGDAKLTARVATDKVRWIMSENDGHGSQRTSLVGHAPLFGTNRLLEHDVSWHMFVWQDSREIFAPADSLLRGVVLAGLVALGLLGILGLYTSRSIVSPIRELRSEVAHIRAGDLERNLDIHTGDEIEELAGEFNEMRLQLRELIENLEEKVEERTRQLKSTEAEKDLVIEHLIQAEKVATIATMASGIGHEINNPLYAIFGIAETIAEGSKVSEYRQYGQEIIKQCRQIAATIKNLSGYVRPGSEHEMDRVDVNEKLADAVSLIKQTLLSDQFEIKQNLSPVPMILAKPEEVQQVFFNIIRNGLQAMGDQGIIEISTHGEDDRVWIEISDQGTGIKKKQMEKIFDPFFTTKGPDEGDGLGLFIVEQIVKKYDGKVSVNSREGVGTTFTICFPAADQMRR